MSCSPPFIILADHEPSLYLDHAARRFNLAPIFLPDRENILRPFAENEEIEFRKAGNRFAARPQ